MRCWHRNTSIMILPVLLAIVFVAGSLRAQTRARSPEDLARRAEVVAVGKVSSLASQWSADHSRIFTHVTLAVNQYIKGGGAGQPLVLVVAGGEVGAVGEVYSHMPTFRQDEDVLVFAEKDNTGSYRVSGGHDGKFHLERDETTGKLYVGNRALDEVTASLRKAVSVQIQR